MFLHCVSAVWRVSFHDNDRLAVYNTLPSELAGEDGD